MGERIVQARVSARTGLYVIPEDVLEEIERGRRNAQRSLQQWYSRDTLGEHDDEEEAQDGSND